MILKALGIPLVLFISLAVSPLPARAGGTYRFPAPERLQAVASWKLLETALAVAEGNLTLKYVLPARLTGTARIEISLTGPARDGIVALSGPQGEASCLVTAGGAACVVALRGLPIDPADVEKYLRATSGSEPEFLLRKEVADAFGSEPIGILELTADADAR
jgi:hypothetical protein